MKITHYTVEPMVIITTWMKIYSEKYFCNPRGGGLDRTLVQKMTVIVVLHRLTVRDG